MRRRDPGSFGLPQGRHLLCSFTSLKKVDAKTFALWARILLQSDNAVMMLSKVHMNADWRDAARISAMNQRYDMVSYPLFNMSSLMAAALEHGIPPWKINVLERASESEFASRASLCDLYLDTLVYSAHVTAYDVLSFGIPLLTVAGVSLAPPRLSGS